MLEHQHGSTVTIRSQRLDVKRLNVTAFGLRDRAFGGDDTIFAVGPLTNQIQGPALDLVEYPAQVLAYDSNHQELDTPEK